ncbi:MAG: hypothetical protein NW217_07555 [Hyphomicrobiaceae bacterium]|nr:hypothetical protein [Hyphomicrobiaceae bacterium]
MKTILSILAAATLYAALAVSAQAGDDYTTRFFEDLRRNGSNLDHTLGGGALRSQAGLRL